MAVSIVGVRDLTLPERRSLATSPWDLAPLHIVSAHAHGVGHAVEPGLHLVEDPFMPPTLDPFQLVRLALRFERAGQAGGQVAVMVDVVLTI